MSIVPVTVEFWYEGMSVVAECEAEWVDADPSVGVMRGHWDAWVFRATVDSELVRLSPKATAEAECRAREQVEQERRAAREDAAVAAYEERDGS